MAPRVRSLALLLGLSTLAAVPGCANLQALLGGGSKASAHQEPSPEQRRQAYVDGHADLQPELREAILAGAIVSGMSHDEVKASLGRAISMAAILPETPEGGDESWDFEQVAYGTQTDFEASGPRESRIFSGVRDTRVRFYRGKVVGVDDLGYTTRDQMQADCNAGAVDTCDRLASLQARAASQPPA